jgi:DnaJ family protein C protein 3
MFLRSVSIIACAVLILVVESIAAASEDSDEFRALLQAGDKLLVKGRSSYRDAIAKYSQALGLVPGSTKGLIRRGELYYMLREWTNARSDLDEVLRRDPHHRKALEIRIKTLEAMGELQAVVTDYTALADVWRKQGNMEKSRKALEEAQRRRAAVQQWAELSPKLDSAASLPVESRLVLMRACVATLKNLIQVSSGDQQQLRLRRAECAIQARMHLAASEEVSHILKRDSNYLPAIVLNAREFRSLGSIDNARAEIRRCLKLDPEYAPCIALHKAVKAYSERSDAAQKLMAEKRYAEAVAAVDTLIASDDAPNLGELWRWKCEAYVELRDVTEGRKACSHIIALEGSEGEANPQLAETYLRLAELCFLEDDLEGAEREINNAAAANQHYDRLREYREKLERVKRQGARKDYYKILGVKKSASDAEIKRAFRKLSKEYHPDILRSQEMSDADRAKYDKLYRDVNEAKTMLMDPEKRRRYDAGEDVAQPQQQQAQQQGFHFHGFPGGGFPGGGFPGGGFPGGGGFQFHFG